MFLYLHCSHARCKIDFLQMVQVLAVLNTPFPFPAGEDLHTICCGTVLHLHNPWCTQTKVPSGCTLHEHLKFEKGRYCIWIVLRLKQHSFVLVKRKQQKSAFVALELFDKNSTKKLTAMLL